MLIVPACANIVEIICPGPEEGTNTRTVQNADKSPITSLKYLETYTYFCENRFTPREGDNFCVQCLANGSLSGPPPTCECKL